MAIGWLNLCNFNSGAAFFADKSPTGLKRIIAHELIHIRYDYG